MSRYQWPAGGDSLQRDRARLRVAHRARLMSAVPPQLVESAAHERAAREARARTARLAPGPDTDLWLPVGPSAVIRGQAGGRPRVAGRVRDLRVSPDGGRAYAATANGGVWFTPDAGTTWSPLGAWATTADADDLARPANTLVSGALHVHFGADVGGGDDAVFVGTGELKPWLQGTPGGTLGGVGVLRLQGSVPAALASPFVNPWRREAANLEGHGIYRLAGDPAEADPSAPTRLVAATSAGIFTRSGPFVENADWTRVEASPLDFDADDPLVTSDLAWAPARDTTPARLWVVLQDGRRGSGNRTGVYVSEAGVAGPFSEVSLPDVVAGGRLGLAVAPSDPAVVYVLGKGPRLWRIDGTSARRVTGIPDHLFGETSDQTFWDLTLDVHPSDPSIVVLGGSTVKADGEWSASLFRLTVSCGSGGCAADFQDANQDTPPADPTFIGNGVHPDVHAVRYVDAPGGVQLWVGCDGGVFRSLEAGDRHTFIARNTGLAVLEPGYVACHPTLDGPLLAGTQDNGMIRRLGGGLWEVYHRGDGGGVAFHPGRPEYWISQYTGASWRSNGTLARPVLRRTTSTRRVQSETDENGAASFYSGVDVVPGTGDRARVVIGTNRVWLSPNWDPSAASASGQQWITLPSATDPRRGGADDTGTDTFEGSRGRVIEVAFVDPDRILALCRRAVLAFERNTSTDTWERVVLSNHSEKCGSFDNDDIERPTSPYLPPLGAWSDLAVHDPGAGDHGSFYVAATGHARLDGDTVVESDRMDTLWWFDGTDTWHPTGLRNDADGGKAPAYAVVVDPSNSDIVYVGTAIGVFRGTLDDSGAAPAWSWEFFANGLPEAAVQDLAFFQAGGIRLLRAAIQARGVWEVDLSTTPTPPGQTYVRVHAFDTRRTRPTPLADPEREPGAELLWNGSPDLRVRTAPGGAAPAPPPGLPMRSGTRSHYQLWVFQSALHAHDPLCEPTGRWTPLFEARLNALRSAHGLSADGTLDAATWGHAMSDGTPFADPWDGTEPSEADLHERIRERTLDVGPDPSDPEERYLWLPRAPGRVHVLVHHRHTRAVEAADVQVLVLRRPLAAAEADGADVALTDAWRNAVEQRMGGATPALPDSWVAEPPAHPAGPVDARLARAATVDIDFGAVDPGVTTMLVLAVVGSTADPVTAAGLAGGTVRELVLGSRHAAARSLWLV